MSINLSCVYMDIFNIISVFLGMVNCFLEHMLYRLLVSKESRRLDHKERQLREKNPIFGLPIQELNYRLKRSDVEVFKIISDQNLIQKLFSSWFVQNPVNFDSHYAHGV